MGSPGTLVDLLRTRSDDLGGQVAFTFIGSDGQEERRLTYADLDREARRIAVRLQAETKPGDRVLLLCPPGLDYVTGFFGCLYAGTIGVPAYPPRNNRNMPRIRAIAGDSGATCCLTTSDARERIGRLFGVVPELEAIRFLATDCLENSSAEDWQPPEATGDTLAILQYTSGSTGTPKGVMVNHANFLHNSEFTCRQVRHSRESLLVSWLPIFHDMGLVLGILQPLYGGFPGVVMAPATFLQKPFRWLEAISRYRATTTVAPNFAYELCVHRISPEERETLDLSCWTNAICGAEPVREDTLKRFVQAFTPCGFKREALEPGYGLAEATLVVSLDKPGAAHTLMSLDKAAYGSGSIVEVPTDAENSLKLVGCGPGPEDQTIAIVDPDKYTHRPQGQVGEIWVKGPSVAKGYWQRESETRETFQAYLSDTGEGPFLRTGDLGFVVDGELFISGRLKDLVIIKGVNYYPHDIEHTVENSHPVLQTNSGAAFAVDVAGEEKLVIVHEVKRRARFELTDVVSSVRAAVGGEHGIPVSALVLVKPLSVPKTSSGKIRRRECMRRFLDEKLESVGEWRERQVGDACPLPASGAGQAAPALLRSDAGEFRQWVATRIAESLDVPERDLDHRQPLSIYGLDSLTATSLALDIERKIGRELSPTLLFNYPSIDSLVHHLIGKEGQTDDAGSADTASVEPIAVVGMACRFPKARNPEEFWQLLRDGVDAVVEVPHDRWDADALGDITTDVASRINTRWAALLEGIDDFDARFFGIAPREVEQMDSQQKLLLEVAWEALEDCGQAADSLAGSRTGVFVGISSQDHAAMSLCPGNLDGIDAYAGSGAAFSIAANRISYFLDLRGPSLAIDTACSSSLVAIHMACESLRRGESDLALAGGVNVMLNPVISVAFARAGMLASDGRCKAFDAEADGYVRGEGCGLVVLKRLSDATADGDTILAVIRGSAVNQDGRSQGLTAPNGPSQEAVVRTALEKAGVEPKDVGFVETHGTGTPLGDPIEVAALGNVLGQGRAADDKCVLGALKTNIGHLEAAAGVAGLIKTVLALTHGEIPPNLHFKSMNPHIPQAAALFTVPTSVRPWPTGPRERFAGVSSFGFGGTNAHVVVSEAPRRTQEESDVERPAHLLTLSAKTPEALKVAAGRLGEYLDGTTASLPDLCYTSNAGRSHFAHRFAATVSSCEETVDLLGSFARGSVAPAARTGVADDAGGPRLAFLFTGQGSQRPGMGKDLYETCMPFREGMDRCEEALRAELERPLLDVLYRDEKLAHLTDDPVYAQTALFCLQWSLSETLGAWGIIPGAVLGHSIGEYAAACRAGAFCLEDGARLVARRARLIKELVPANGRMVACLAGCDVVSEVVAPLRGQVAIAAVNGPEHTVISGGVEAVDMVVDSLQKRNIRCRTLHVSHPFHSSLLQPMLGPFKELADGLACTPPSVPLISTLTGEWLEPGRAPDGIYWRNHLREPVQFLRGMQTLIESDFNVFWEIGPRSSLIAMGKCCAADLPEQSVALTWLPSLLSDRGDWQVILDSLAQYYVRGGAVDWQGFDRGYKREIVSLPTYPFERERFRSYRQTRTRGSGGREDRTWCEAVDAARKCIQRGVPDSSWAREHAKLTALNEIATSYVYSALRDLGAFRAAGDRTSVKEILLRCGISSDYERTLSWWLGYLCERGIVIRDAEDYVLTESTFEDPASACRKGADLWSDEPFVPELVKRCGESLADVLVGKLGATEVLFPKGSSESLGRIYGESSLARLFNGVVAETVRSLAGSEADGRRLRILELGAGTGATTAAVLPACPPTRTEYRFTDVGEGFLQRAKTLLRGYAFIEYGLLDIERDPEAQGFAKAGSDVVIAANVLHATRDLEESVEHVASLTAPGGYLVLWEATRMQPWFGLTFGLLEGWRRFEDRDLRRRSPLLEEHGWLRLLAGCGFDRVHAFPERGSEGATLGQHVILARKAPLPTTVVSAASPPVTESKTDVTSMPDVDEETASLLYKVLWTESPSPAPAPVGTEGDAERKGVWLLLADAGGTAEGLSRALEARGERAILVWHSADYEALPGGHYRISPDRPHDFHRLTREVFASTDAPSCLGVVHLWNLDTPPPPDLSPDALVDAGRLGCESVANLLRNMVAFLGLENSGRFWIVTRGAQTVGSEAPAASVAQAPAWGVGRTIASEFPELWGGLIDLDYQAGDDDGDRLVDVILARNTVGGELVFRDRRHYTPRLVRIGARALGQARTPAFQANATYLVTGGLGGIGLTVARWMVTQGARRLLLMGRSKLPPRSAWKMSDLDDTLAGKIAAILDLEALGCSVHLAAVDVGDRDQLLEFLDGFRKESWPPIRGVFHAAGEARDRPLVDLDHSDWGVAARAKVTGAWLLHELLDRDPLDFFVMCSSVVSLLGLPALGSYAAANSFLDALAHYRHSLGLPALAINWGPWSGVGMAVKGQQTDRALTPGLLSLSPTLGQSVLAQCLDSELPQLAAVKADWPAMLRSGHLGKGCGLLKDLAPQHDGDHAGRGLVVDPLKIDSKEFSSDPEVRREQVRTVIVGHVMDIMSMRDTHIDPKQSLSLVGLDSIMAVELQHLLEADLKIVLPIADLASSSLDSLVALAMERVAGEVSR